MDIVYRSRPNDINWPADGLIAPHVEAFKRHLADGSYASSTVAGYLSNIAHFAQWARGKRLRLQRIDEASIVPFNVIALWLGHECMTTTHRYVEADLAMKQKALARLEPPNTKMRRCQAPDSLMRFLQTL